MYTRMYRDSAEIVNEVITTWHGSSYNDGHYYITIFDHKEIPTGHLTSVICCLCGECVMASFELIVKFGRLTRVDIDCWLGG